MLLDITVKNTFVEVEDQSPRKGSMKVQVSRSLSDSLLIKEVLSPQSITHERDDDSEKNTFGSDLCRLSTQDTDSDTRRSSIQSYHSRVDDPLEVDYTDIPPAKSLDSFVESHEVDATQWTTCMIRNIPCRYQRDWVLEDILATGLDVDFFYLPPATRTKGNLGYAFANFVTPEQAKRFMEIFEDHAFPRQPNSAKRAKIQYAKLQGLAPNLDFFINTLTSRGEFRPWVPEGSKFH